MPDSDAQIVVEDLTMAYGDFLIQENLNFTISRGDVFVIMGGSGTIAGPVIGAFIVVFLPEVLRFADSFRLIIYGLILVLATIFMPRGIVGVASQLWDKVAKRSGS